MKKEKDKKICYLNELARINNKFTLEEEKVLHLIFSQINPYGNNPTTFKLNKLDFFNKLELDSTNRYPRYRKLVKGLINKTLFEVVDEQGGIRIGVVITDSYWKPKEPYFEVSLNPNFMPYLEQLIKNYTIVNLDNVLSLNSKHSLTLYKWLCSWTDDSKNENKRYITTKDLKELLGLSVDSYVQNNKFNRADFERRVLNKSIDDINKETNITVKVKKNKFGNFVKNYEFNWKQKVKPLKAIESKVVKQDKKIVATMKKPKFITKKQITIDDVEKEQFKNYLLSLQKNKI